MIDAAQLLRSVRPIAVDANHAPARDFRLEHRVDVGTDELEISSSWPDGVPDSLGDLWREAREAWLFRDVDYGQWGLHLLDPRSSAVRTKQQKQLRPADFAGDDIVFGEFLGDADLVVLTGGGAIRIALPLDSRAEWPEAAGSLGEFFAAFLRSAGEKYWETETPSTPDQENEPT